MLENIPGTLPFVKAGRLRVLAVTDSKRSPLLPEVPTLAESGVKNYELVGWNGLFAPRATPQPIVDKLRTGIAKLLSQPDVKERLATLGAEGVGDTPETLPRIHPCRDRQVGEGRPGRRHQSRMTALCNAVPSARRSGRRLRYATI